MPDNLLIVVFGVLSAVGIVMRLAGFALAVRHAKKKNGELKMALWSFVGLAGLVLAGMSWAYFLFPILLNHLFGGGK